MNPEQGNFQSSSGSSGLCKAILQRNPQHPRARIRLGNSQDLRANILCTLQDCIQWILKTFEKNVVLLKRNCIRANWQDFCANPPHKIAIQRSTSKKSIQRSVGGRRGHLALCTREMTGFFWNGFWKYSGNSRTCDKMPAQGSFQKSNELCAKDSTKDLIHRCVFCTQLISVLCPFLSPHEVSRLRSLYVLFFFHDAWKFWSKFKRSLSSSLYQVREKNSRAGSLGTIGNSAGYWTQHHNESRAKIGETRPIITNVSTKFEQCEVESHVAIVKRWYESRHWQGWTLFWPKCRSAVFLAAFFFPWVAGAYEKQHQNNRNK